MNRRDRIAQELYVAGWMGVISDKLGLSGPAQEPAREAIKTLTGPLRDKLTHIVKRYGGVFNFPRTSLSTLTLRGAVRSLESLADHLGRVDTSKVVVVKEAIKALNTLEKNLVFKREMSPAERDKFVNNMIREVFYEPVFGSLL